MNVATNAPSQVANQATVSGGGWPSSLASDPATVDVLQRCSNPLAFATSASVVAGVPTILTVTYTNDNGPADIASGQVKIDNCYLAWDHSGNVTLYRADGFGLVSSVLGLQTLLSAGNCSIDLSNSSLSTPSGNPKALVLKLNITFPAQAYPSTDDRYPSPEFVGPHEVYGWGTSVGGLATGQVDLGSLVVSQGQDFTVTVGTSDAVNLGTNASLNVTVSAAGLNGFSGSIPLGVQVIAGSPCFVFMGNGQYSVQTNGQATITVKNNNCMPGSAEAFTVHGSAIGIRRITSTIFLVATASGDFSVGVGTPSPAVLQPQSSISYPVIVSSSNGQSGNVNLTLDAYGIPAGVSSSFSPPQVYLSGTGSTATSYLTLYSSANTPPGTYPLRVFGNLGGARHFASFSLSTQVTTFQVTSATGSAIVHNTGQEVQVTHTVTSGNVPANATCDSADPNVTCRVISSYPGTVTLGITASTSAPHGTHVLSLNGARSKVHAIVGDYFYGGMLGLSPGSIQAGAPPASATLSLLGTPACEINGYCGNPEVIVDSPVEADITGWNANTFSVSLYAGASTKAANYEISLSLCGGYVDAWDEINTEACVAGPAFLQVTAAPQAPPPPVLQIIRTGTSTVVSGSNQPTVVSVGEKIDLTATVSGLPSGVTVSQSSWVVTGMLVGNYAQSIQRGAATAFKDPGGDHAVFYWTNSDNVTDNQVTYIAKLTDGTTLPVTAVFHVVRPSPTAISGTILPDSPDKPAINATDRGFFNPSIPSLNLGYNGTPGITFDLSIRGATFHGSVAMTQLVQFSTIRQSGTATSTTASQGYVLDNKLGIQYNGPVDLQGHDGADFALDDSPAVGLPLALQHVAANQEFRTYLMYKPPSPGSIWVTLRVLTWGWSAGATKGADGIWTVDKGASAPAPEPGIDRAELPQWNNYATNPQQ